MAVLWCWRGDPKAYSLPLTSSFILCKPIGASDVSDLVYGLVESIVNQAYKTLDIYSSWYRYTTTVFL